MLMKPMTRRADVYAAIDTERFYQDQKWGHLSTHNHEIAAWILYMEHHLAKARAIASTSAPGMDALHELRKVVALGVACMEEHSAPIRVLASIDAQPVVLPAGRHEAHNFSDDVGRGP